MHRLNADPNEKNKSYNKKQPGAAIIAASVAALWIAFELILFFLSMPMAPEQDFGSLSNTEIGESYTVTREKLIKISDSCGAINTISFDAVTAEGEMQAEPVTVTVSGYDPAVSRKITYKTEKFAPGNSGKVRAVIRLDVPANASGITVTLSHAGADYSVSDFRINSKADATFNFLRTAVVLSVIALVYLSIRFNMWSCFWSGEKHGMAALGICLVCLILALALASVLNASVKPISYPLEYGVGSYNQYIQQFDALQKGQLHINYAPSKGLLELENPYDYGAREGISYLWDRAFYDGKYYSYFGMAPIFTVYYPCYLLTGSLPADDTVTTVFAVMTAIFFSMAAVKWAATYTKRVPLPLVAVGTVAALISTQVFMIMRGYSKVYYIATIAGMAFLSAFIWLMLCGISGSVKLKRAEGEPAAWFRPLVFALAGVAYGLCFLSRFNIALTAAFVILPILWFKVVRERKEDGSCGFRPIGRMLVELACLALPVILAVGYQLYLNAARFDSIFEFGTTYQLTVSDVSKNKLRLTDLPAAIFHYFLQPVSLSSDSGMVSLFFASLGNYGHYVYVDTGMGLLSIPLTWGLFGAIGIFRGKRYRLDSRLTVGALLCGLVAVALFDFCLGGVIFRYTCDLTLLAAFASMAILYAVYEDVSEHCTGSAAATLNIAAVLLLAVSAVMSISLAFSLNGNLTDYSPEAYVLFKSFFR